MTVRQTSGDEPHELLSTARRALEIERRKLGDEHAAFEAFVDRVREIPTTVKRSVPIGNGRHVRRSSSLASVRRAYEETVMSVPHYAEEYDDTYSENVREEFGPDVAATVVHGEDFSNPHKRAVLEAAEEARARRDRFVDDLDEEYEYLLETTATLRSLSEDLTTMQREEYSTARYGTLEAHYTRLEHIRAQLDDLATERQARIHGSTSGLRRSDEPADVQTYLYRDLDSAYPILSVVARLRTRVEQLQRTVERSIAALD